MPETPDLRVIGRTGLPVYGGRVYDEEILALRGERGRQIVREMSEQDPVIGGILFSIEMLSRQVNWAVVPAQTENDDQSEQAQEIADFVLQALRDMMPSWEETLSEILSMLPYGWSWLEILYKRRDGQSTDPLKRSRYKDGKIGWRGWAIRSQTTLLEWLYRDEQGRENTDGRGELIAMKQLAPPDYQTLTIPREKSLHFKTKSRRQNPEGVSILRAAYRPWYFKKQIETIEGIGIERDLAGLPIVWVPPDLLSDSATPDEKALLENLKKLVTNIRRDEQEGVIMPLAFDDAGHQIYDLKLLSTGGQRQFDTNQIIDRYDQRIAMSMMADFVLLGHDAVGSFALSSDKTALFATALGAILDVIVAEINAHAIPKLVLVNGWDLELCPTLQHGDIESSDLARLGDFLQKLAGAGMTLFPNSALEEYLLEQAGLPTTGREEALEPPQGRLTILTPEERAQLSNVPQNELAQLGSTTTQPPPQPQAAPQQTQPAQQPRRAAEPSGDDLHTDVPLGVDARKKQLRSFERKLKARTKVYLSEMLRVKLGRDATDEEVETEYAEWEAEHLAGMLAQASEVFDLTDADPFEFANPRHDAKGRFASAPGGASDSTSSRGPAEFKDRLGKCYQLAGNYALDNPNAELVHGSIQGFGNPRIGHAWANTSEGVWEPATNRIWESHVFKAVFNPIVDRVYSHEQLLKQILSTKTWGPWTSSSGLTKGREVIESDALDELEQFWAGNVIKGKKGFQSKNEASGAPGYSSTEEHYKRADGSWDPERVASVHEPILASFTEGVEKATGPVTVYMTGGGYGSGKSTAIINNPETGFPDKTKAARIDPDAIKQGIPEYRELVGRQSYNSATYAHEESSYLAKVGVQRAIRAGYNVLYDTSGDTSPEKLGAKVAQMRTAGARRVVADYATPLSTAEAQRRADARAGGSSGNRRYVSHPLLVANHAEVSRTWYGAAKAGTFDRLRLWSTAGPLGTRPKLIASARNGKITVRDQAAYETFLAIGGITP